MQLDKIRASLSAAVKYLEDSMMTLSSSIETAGSDSLWSASAEAEYAVFLLSLTQGDRAESAPWKHGSSSKQPIELEPALTSALELLKDAVANVEAGNLEKAYEETWTARNLLQRAQEMLEKKRKESKK